MNGPLFGGPFKNLHLLQDDQGIADTFLEEGKKAFDILLGVNNFYNDREIEEDPQPFAWL